MTDEPQMGGTLTANSEPDDIMSEPTSDAMSMPDQSEKEPLLDHENGNEPVDAPDAMQPAPPSWMPDQSWMSAPAVADDPTAPTDKTLAEIEASVDSPHLTQNDEPAAQDTPQEDSLDTARDEVFKALEGAPDPMPEPSQALNAQVIDLNPPQPDDVPTDLPVEPAQAPGGSTDFNRDNFAVHNDTETLAPVEPVADFAAPADPELTTPVEQPYTMPLPGAINLPPANPVAPTSVTADPNTPPVPPPFPFATADQQK
jgi:hypothetical protein